MLLLESPAIPEAPADGVQLPLEQELLGELAGRVVRGAGADTVLEHIAQLAATACGVAGALVTCTDDSLFSDPAVDTHSGGASHGPFDDAVFDEATPFCMEAMRGSGVEEVPDTRNDARFSANRLSLGGEPVCFYAGIALRGPDGLARGSLCIFDTRSRFLTAARRKALRGLAALAEQLLETRHNDARARWLAQIVDEASHEFVVFEPRTLRVLYANPGALLGLGYTAEQVTRLTALDLMADGSHEEFGRHLALLRSGAAQATRRTVLRRCDGTQFPAELRLQMRGGSEPAGIMFITDVAAQQRGEIELRSMERARRMLAECNRALVHAVDEQQLLDEICRIAVEVGNYPLAWAGVPEFDEFRTIRPVAHAGCGRDYIDRVAISWHEENEMGRGTSGAAVRSGRPAVLRDLVRSFTTPASVKQNMQRLGLASLASLPLMDDGVCIGVITIYACETDAFREDELVLLEELAADIGYGITALRARNARRDAEQSRQDSERLFRAIVSQANAGINLTDLGSRFTMVNDKYCEIVGYTRAELLGMDLRDILVTDRVEDVVRLREELLSGQREGYTVESMVRAKDGREIWVRAVTSLLRREDGGPLYFLSMVEDISERKRTEAALRESEQRFRAVVNQANTGIAMSAPGTMRFTFVNDHYCRMLGYSREELLGMSVADIVAEDSVSRVMNRNADLIKDDSDGGALRMRHCNVRKDGSRIWVDVSVALIRDENGEPVQSIGVIEDVTERQRMETALRASQEQFHQLADNIPQVFWIADAAPERMVYISPAFAALTGRDWRELGGTLREIIAAVLHPDDLGKAHFMNGTQPPEGGDEHELRIVRADGEVRWIRSRSFPILDAEGRVYRYAGIAEDITERRNREARIISLENYDELTGLSTRSLYQDHLTRAIAQAERTESAAAVCLVDIDRFKNINDTLGYAGGDALLKMAAQRLSDCLRPGDTIGRHGGDEFIVILAGLRGEHDAAIVAEKLQAAIAQPFIVEGRSHYLSCSIGVALCPHDAVDGSTLISHAGAAMGYAKDLGGSYRFYSPEMNVQARQRAELESDLRRALEANEFRVYYQPKASLADGKVSGLEALLRWQHPRRGVVNPAEFIPVLEETGLIVPVGRWVMRLICAQLRAWRNEGMDPVPVAVNLSARQFQSPQLRAHITEAIREFDIDPHLVEIEITESSLMRNPDDTAAVLAELKALGLKVSIDDFGTGYSNLAYLKRFPLDTLKIDRAFVKDIGSEQDDSAIILALITMAHSLGLKVVAEGVETEAQLTFLSSRGCDEIQGFYFARPMNARDSTRFLRARIHLTRPQAGSLPPPTVLLVDDDPQAPALLARALHGQGYRILTVTTVREALARMAHNNVCAVISDQYVPGMAGVEFHRRVKLANPQALRIILSGDSEITPVSDAVRRGDVHGFLMKEWKGERLRAVLTDVFRAAAPVAAAPDKAAGAI